MWGEASCPACPPPPWRRRRAALGGAQFVYRSRLIHVGMHNAHVPSVAERIKKHRTSTLVPVARARCEPQRGPGAGDHTLPLRIMACVFVAGTAQRPESVSGRREPVSNLRIKFGHSTGIARSGGGSVSVRILGGSGPAQQAMLSEGSDPANLPKQNIRAKFILKKCTCISICNSHRCTDVNRLTDRELVPTCTDYELSLFLFTPEG